MSALRRRDSARPVALEARVSNADPDELTVTIDDFDGSELARHAWPVANVPTGRGTPVRGDRCLVVTSELGRAWIVAAEWTGPVVRWETLTLVNGWEAFDANFPIGIGLAPNGWVSLRGIVRHRTTPTAGQVLVATLPRAVLPGTRRSFPAAVGGGLCGRLNVRPEDGALIAAELPRGMADGALWTLDGIGYWAED